MTLSSNLYSETRSVGLSDALDRNNASPYSLTLYKYLNYSSYHYTNFWHQSL